MKSRVKTEKKYNDKRKIVNIFQNSKWKQEYAIELNNRFEILENMENEDNNDNNIKQGAAVSGVECNSFKCQPVKTCMQEWI